MAGIADLSNRIAQAKAKRDEASSQIERLRESHQRGLERREERQQQQAARPVQGPPQRIERPSFARPNPEVQHTNIERPYTGTPEIESRSGRPVYNPDDSTRYQQESDTVGYMEPRRERENRPPRPNVLPEVTPVASLKNRVAREHQYSDKARNMLYNTPTHVRFAPYGDWLDESHVDTGTEPNWQYRTKPAGVAWRGRSTGEMGGEFRNPLAAQADSAISSLMAGERVPPYQIYVSGDEQRLPAEEVLAHEFAHKWFNQKFPTWQKAEWALTGPAYASEYGLERADARMPRFSPTYSSELYAHTAEHGPYEIDPAVRDRFYGGMYRDDLGQPPPSPVVVEAIQSAENYATPDIGAMRRDYYSPRQWVPESYAPWGYYADGTSQPPPMQERRWSSGWPSLELYTLAGRG